MRSFLARTLFASCGLALAALCASPAMAQSKRLKIATEGAYAPWNFSEPSGKLAGFDVELANDLCRRINAQCEIVAQDWDGIIPGLNVGKYDAIVAAMSVTEKRKEAVAFTRPYAGMPAYFGVLKTNPLAKSLPMGNLFSLDASDAEVKAAIDRVRASLRGKIIGVQGSTTLANFMDKYMKGEAQVREYKTAEQILIDLEAGRIDASLNSRSYWDPLLEKPEGQNLALVGPGFTGGVFGAGVAIAVRKSDGELRKVLDSAIGDAVTDGTIKRFSEKWFKIDITPLPTAGAQ